MKNTMKFDSAQTLVHLNSLLHLRGQGATLPARLSELKVWQAQRLEKTYQDLAANKRYSKATDFFLHDLYGERAGAKCSQRDADLKRVFPLMLKVLPEAGVLTAAKAIEVDALSEALDQRIAVCLPAGAITESSYAQAYRQCGTPQERERQIVLINAVGTQLESVVSRAWVHATLKMMRGPAKAAGLGELQLFLERGATAFKSMNGAGDFLATIAQREREIAIRLFSSHPQPFSL
jgi:hypothetical protein